MTTAARNGEKHVARDGRLRTAELKKCRATVHSQSYATFFRHSAVLSLQAVLLRKLAIREFKQITTAGATTAIVTEKIWGEYGAVVF